jgi:tetratricopeptide (TPR) repeat protein
LPLAFPSRPGRQLIDGALLALLVVTAFLLGCYEMGDSDIWWHLRGGEWVLEHGRAPRLDPFTFGSADKVWVDIHWGYEVILALAYRAGGAGALVVLGASVGAGAFLACLLARRREWPAAVAVLCWAPALVLLAFRLDPRPEIFSLLYIGAYLAVLCRAEDHPALAWLLPAVQVLWVNMQGLFILGPVLLGLFLAAHAAQLLWDYKCGRLTWDAGQRRWWRHVGGAACAVGAACLVNPYFLDGARFPFDLFPKVAQAGNPYKRYIDELMSPRDFVNNASVAVAGANWFFLAFQFLLVVLPVSFLYPSLWRAVRESRARSDPRTSAWLTGLAAVVVLLALNALTVSDRGAPGWVVALGDNVPLLLFAAGAAFALRNRKASPRAAALGIMAATALAAWVAWLRAALLGGGRGPVFGPDSAIVWGVLAAAAGAGAAALTVRSAANVFRVMLAAAFAYLGLQALQNWSRFALVAGTVLAWNFGEWAAALAALRRPGEERPALGWGLRVGLTAGLGLWIAALLGGRYYVHTGEPRHLAFREEPLEFAHEATAFAGQPGLPDRALVYGLGQACVYTYHNAPRCKPFIDGRLEMPDQATFETYVDVENWLRDRDPRWESAVARMGDPLLLLEHQNNHAAEALLLTHPRWRCVYYDALASVFVRRESAAEFPTVDFAGRHFRQAALPSAPAARGAAAREQKALFNLATSLPPSPEATWRWRIPVLLCALDRSQAALAEDPARPDSWVLLGTCCWNLDPDRQAPPLAPAEGWRLERNLYLAQATYCFRHALEHQPDNAPAWRYLAQAYRVRRMADAQVTAAERWLQNDPKSSQAEREQVSRLRAELAREPTPPAGELTATVTRLLQRHRPEAAVALLDGAGMDAPAAWGWSFAEQAAGLYMHLGRPADARRVWQQAIGCPSATVRECRLAATFWVERDFGAAREHFYVARAADPRLAEACWGLAMLHAQCGDVGAALEACRAGLEVPLNDRQRADLTALEQLLVSQQGSR